jgi:surfactin synthase thioesterase subunit
MNLVEKAGGWVVCPRRATATGAMRLFVFPHAGGAAEQFARWAKLVVPAIELAFVQYPGRGSRYGEPTINSMEPMISQLVEALQPLFDRPFAFFGHSMGALIAYELARRIETSPGGLARVFLSGCPFPKRITRRCSGMNDEQLIAFLADMGGTPPEVLEHSELLQLLIPFLRSDFELYETYEFRPGLPLNTPFSLCFGSADPETEPGDAARWGELTNAGYQTRWFKGSHFYLHQEAPSLTAWISSVLLSQCPPESL